MILILIRVTFITIHNVIGWSCEVHDILNVKCICNHFIEIALFFSTNNSTLSCQFDLMKNKFKHTDIAEWFDIQHFIPNILTVSFLGTFGMRLFCDSYGKTGSGEGNIRYNL